MRFIAVCCFILGVVCAKPSCDECPMKRNAETVDKLMVEEAVDFRLLGDDNLDVTPPVSMMKTEDSSANDEKVTTTTPGYEQTADYDHRAETTAEGQDLGLEEFFEDFTRTEMSTFLEVIPSSLGRRLRFGSHPCKKCIIMYLKCKDICLQLLPESVNHILDSFACIITCWQRVTTCCIAGRRNRPQPPSTEK
ncbi:uncharacterized protein [Panulirus ornatus]|uniref:uncharacterized protein n=1 Tax=Panulirus ornatus TaxID=150431 RepID=UPI003A84814C